MCRLACRIPSRGPSTRYILQLRHDTKPRDPATQAPVSLPASTPSGTVYPLTRHDIEREMQRERERVIHRVVERGWRGGGYIKEHPVYATLR